MSLREYNNFISEIMPTKSASVEDKDKNAFSMILYHFMRLQRMFHYTGLPGTIPERFLEMYLQINGHCAIFQHEGNLYCAKGGFGGEPDPYYVPTLYVVANPYLKLSKTFKRDEDCIVLGNDMLYYGLFPLVSKYCSAMAENELSMNISVINARIMSLITATTDEEKAAAEKFIADIKDGNLSAIGQSPFFEGVKTQPYATGQQSNALTNLIEYEQYLKASLFNELGLNANYNMKRESINSNESQLNDDMLTPLIDEMLKCRKEGIDKVNDMFGTDISVDFDSAWKENEQTTMLEMEGLLNEGSDNDSDGADPVADSADSGISEGSEPEEVSEGSAEDAAQIIADAIVEAATELSGEQDPEQEEASQDEEVQEGDKDED